MERRIARLAGATGAARTEDIATVWSGYGDVARYALTGAEAATVVVKHIRPGKGGGRSHDRKLRSYEVEQAWYREWSSRCGEGCRVAACLAVERQKGEWVFVLEDLCAAGFTLGRPYLSDPQLHAALRWLAAFHATFLGERPRGLWKTGTYWHLRTRPDEHRAMAAGPLRDAAAAIDARLSGARHLTLVQGDAKPTNFGFSADGRAAAVDFQYVGGGVGVKDVAYLLAGEDRAAFRRGHDVYFRALRRALPASIDGAALEAEWRALVPWAWADFHRFLAGWEPSWRFQRHELALTDQVLSEVRGSQADGC